MHEAVDTHLDAGAEDPRQVGNRAVHCLRQDWAHACRIIEANSGQRIPIALRLVRHALSLRNKYLKIPQILALGGCWWTSLDHDREGIAWIVESLSTEAFPKGLEKLPYLLPPADFG